MGSPGRHQNRKQQPCILYSNEDIILNRCDEYISRKAVAIKCARSRFPPCGTVRCRPSTCWHLIRWRKRWRTQTLTGFGQPDQPQTLSKLASLRSVEMIAPNGSSKGTFAPV